MMNACSRRGHGRLDRRILTSVLGAIIMTQGSSQPARSAGAVPALHRCRLCRCHLTSRTDDLPNLVCCDCKKRPEAARLGPPPKVSPSGTRPARSFTAADKALIRKIHAHLSATQLLELLNERLFADLGPDVVAYSMEQLLEELRITGDATVAGDWVGIRRLLADARRSGLLSHITSSTIDDFSVVFSLTQAQVLRLRDVLLSDSTETDRELLEAGHA